MRVVRTQLARRCAVASAISLIGCGQVDRSRHPLDGEWEVRIEAAPTAEYAAWNGRLRAGEVRRARGVMVFHPEIARYPEDEWFPEQIVGRGYVDFGMPFADTTGVAGKLFRIGGLADSGEQVIARVDSTATVELYPIPFLIGSDPSLRGMLRDDTIRGEYAHLSHLDTLLTGSFVMWRVPRSEFTDSALIRSARGVRAWLDPDPPRLDNSIPEYEVREEDLIDTDEDGPPPAPRETTP